MGRSDDTLELEADRVAVGFDQARTNRAKYIAEICALALPRPKHFKERLPTEQSEWLKRVVFGSATGAEWARRLAMCGGLAALAARLLRTYASRQANALMQRFVSPRSADTGGQGA